LEELNALYVETDIQIGVLVDENDSLQRTIVRNAVRGNTGDNHNSYPSKSTKLPDPDLLDDGKSPSFKSWLAKMRSKFDVNRDHYDTESAQMAYVFSRTIGMAKEHLQPRYKSDDDVEFQTAEEMIDYLKEIFTNPFKQRTTDLQFKNLTMQKDKAFHDFYTLFLKTAAKAKVPKVSYQSEL
jgi:hypothetical protein